MKIVIELPCPNINLDYQKKLSAAIGNACHQTIGVIPTWWSFNESADVTILVVPDK